jgi:hypothetical protein
MIFGTTHHCTALHAKSQHDTTPHHIMQSKTYIAEIESRSPISFSRFHGTAKQDGETGDLYEKRTWREKVLADSDGNVLINPMAIKFALCAAAKYLGRQIPGKGKRTYSKIFDSAILCVDEIHIGVKKDQTDEQWVYANADGKRGSGTRVMRCFPTVRKWKARVKLYVLDAAITAEVLKEHFDAAGLFIGIGQFRIQQGGTNGRFEVTSLKTA